MKAACFIHSYPGATETLRLLWPGFRLLGLPLIGVETIDGNHEWPEPIQTVKIGRNVHWLSDRRNLPRRLIGTLKYFLSTDYERACIVEYDSLICGPMPEYPPGLTCHATGGRLPSAECPSFHHTPWIVDRATAEALWYEGMKLIVDGTCDRGPHGSPDVFLGLLIDRLKLPWNASGTFSANTIEGTFVEPAREAYRAGCWFFHGVKTQEHIDSINQ